MKKFFNPVFWLLSIILFTACGSSDNEKESTENNLEEMQTSEKTQNQPGSEAQLSRLGKIQPKKSSDIEGSYWGIQAGSLADSVLEKAAELGVKWTRLHARWEEIEQEKGQFNWHETDEAFEAVLKYGITPFVTLGQGHRLYSGTGNYDDPKLAAIYGESPAPPTGSQAEMDAWLNFVTATIDRYKDQIQYWEIWNEPNHRKYWGAPPNGEDYGRLVKATAAKIRELQPDAKIIAGSTAGIDADFVDAFLSQSDPSNIDIISFHNYANIPEDRVYRMPDYLQAINKYNPDIELWQGECGYPSHSRTTGFRGRAPWGLNIQAKWLLRQALVDTWFCGATLSNYFLLAHDGELNPDPRPGALTGVDSLFGYPERGGSRLYSNGVNQKCILFREDNSPKPGFHAYQNLTASMDNRYKPFRTKYEFQIHDQGVFYGLGVQEDAYPSVPLVASYKTNQDQYWVAYWLPWNAQEHIEDFATVSLKVNGASYDDPVLLDLLTGEVFAMEDVSREDNSVKFNNVPLGDYPIAIVERDEIEFQ